MTGIIDGPASPLFSPLKLQGNIARSRLPEAGVSAPLAASIQRMPAGSCVCWGIPFDVGDPILLNREPVHLEIGSVKHPWLVFLHTADITTGLKKRLGFELDRYNLMFQLGERAADYVFLYADGSEERVAIKKRYQISTFTNAWGDNCFEAVHHIKPRPLPAGDKEKVQNEAWGWNQHRADAMDSNRTFLLWLWAWQNPHPDKEIVGLRLEPGAGSVILFGISQGHISSQPFRWQSRRKALLTLPQDETLDSSLDDNGLFKQIQLDLGQVISVGPRPIYPNDTWENTYNNQLPKQDKQEVLVEYTAHPEARFHLSGGQTVTAQDVEEHRRTPAIEVVPPADQPIVLKAREKGTSKPIAVKLHIHGEFGEYLPPINRHRIPNGSWFQDYSVDFSHQGRHHCSYVPGETKVRLPQGKVFLEASKGFEMRPVRQVLNIASSTREVVVELEKTLGWREKGWVTADTHVHFLSPQSALLEGEAEGVNVVNLLASQWGEMFTNIGDFDGKTVLGSREAGGNGEYLVRVGTENRQHVLGHISLLGYEGDMITPLCAGGPEESAMGDPVDVLLTEWARQCKSQGGLVVLPHFPFPKCEHAAAIVAGQVDAVESTSLGFLYGGINPYSLVDWYRYLNCGYLVAAVGGTDKMSAQTAVGTSRTYAFIGNEQEFTYQSWKEAVRQARTFVTYGPLLEFSVEGQPMGARLDIPATGGAVNITWKAASATIPMSRVELIMNGEIRESREIQAWADEGHWTITLDKSAWLALLIRGHYEDKPEIIAAHSSPVMVRVAGSEFIEAADALSILEQIEGALAFIDHIGTRADAATYKRMRLVLTSAHRELHNRLHQLGHYHVHQDAPR